METLIYGSLICKVCSSRYPKCFEEEGKRKWNHKNFCPTCKDHHASRKPYSATDERFIEAVKNSSSIREVLTNLGMRAAGGNYASFHHRIKRLNLDTSHFTGGAHMTGKNFGPKRSIEDYLSNKFKIGSSSLKKRILNEGLKPHKCEECNQEWWLYKKIPLELHHINGNHFDNTFENLQLLCPNCHVFTDNYRGKNQSRSIDKSNKIEPLKEVVSAPKFEAQNELVKSSRYKPKYSSKEEAMKAVAKQNEKIIWPNNEILAEMVWQKSVSKLAKEFGVTDNAVRHRCKHRGIPVPPVGYWRKLEVGQVEACDLIRKSSFQEKMVAQVGPAPTLKRF